MAFWKSFCYWPHAQKSWINTYSIDGLMQKRRNSIVDTLELRLFCTKLLKLQITID